MKPRDINPTVLPSFLQRDLIKNVKVEDVQFLEQDEVLMCEDTGELFLSKETELDDETRRPKQVFGRVGVMLATIVDKETNELLSGFVADFRYIENANEFSYAADAEAPDDQEERNKWEDQRRDEVPIAAIAVWDADREESLVVGDQRFGEAVLYLADEADKVDREIARLELEARKKDAAANKVKRAKQRLVKKAVADQADEKVNREE